jgi:predicted permease
MNGLLQDLRYALRQLRKSPGFTTVAVLTLALGIGANTAVFSVVEAVMLRTLPYADANQLVLIQDSQDPEKAGFLLKDIDALRSQTRSFSDIAFYYRDSGFSNVTLTNGAEPESVQGAFASSNLFSVMGVAPALGRVFSSDEETRREHVVILSHGLWARQFGSTPDAVGRYLQVNGEPFQIIGVMPQTFQFPARDQQFWAPITTNRYWGDPSLNNVDPSHSRYAYERWQAVGRLAGSVSLARAQAELGTVFSRISQADPDPNRGSGITAAPLRVVLSGNTRLALFILFVAVAFVLLITCSNVANLVLARRASREREIAVRSALGAGRTRLAREFFTESAVMALISGAMGLGFASLGLHFLIAFAPPGIPRIEEAGLDGGVLAFTIAISFMSAVAFGLAPAWKSSNVDPSESLRAGIAVAGQSRKRTRSALVISELSIAVVLLAGSGLLVRSFVALRAVDPGFEPKRVLTVNVSPPPGTPESRNALYNAVLERVRSIPGIEAAGEADSLFELGNLSNLGLRAIDGRMPEPRDQWTPLSWASVRGDYFQTMGATLLRGRYFGPDDGPHSPLVAIIDESMARRYWPGEDPIGKRFKGQDARGLKDDWLTVVGVVHDMRRSGLEKNPIPHVFEPSTQAIDGDRTSYLIVRTAGDPRSIASELRAVVRGISSTAIISDFTTLEQELDEQLSPRRFQTSVLGIFSAIALGLAAFGLFGLMHYSVVERTKEIGVRSALGARRIDIFRLVLTEAAKLASLGIAIGLCGAFVLTRFIASLLFGVRPIDGLTFAASSLLLMIFALLASWLPARRAAKVDPMVALRYE